VTVVAYESYKHEFILRKNALVKFSSVYFCIPTMHRILHQEYRDRKRRP